MKPTVAALATVASLFLSACASTGGVVADNVPTWLGGMPNDVPPGEDVDMTSG